MTDVVRFTRRPPSRHPVSKASTAAQMPAAPPPVAHADTDHTTPPSGPTAPRPRRSAPPAPAASTVVSWVRLLPDQAERLAELVFTGNRELEDEARSAGTYRVRAQHRLTESDVIRYAVDQLLAQGGWAEHRTGLRNVVGQTRKPGRPAGGGKR